MATTTGSKSPGALETKVQNALVGVQQAIPAGSTLSINGGPMTQAQLALKLSGYLPVFQNVRNDQQAYAQAVAARTAMEPDAREFLVLLRAALIAQFGRGSLLLTKFGMSSGKRTPPTPQTTVLAAAKATLTRTKRGTLSKKAQQRITVVSQPQVTIGTGKPQIAPPTVDATPARGTAAPAPQSGAAQSPAAPAQAPVAPAPAGGPVKA